MSDRVAYIVGTYNGQTINIPCIISNQLAAAVTATNSYQEQTYNYNTDTDSIKNAILRIATQLLAVNGYDLTKLARSIVMSDTYEDNESDELASRVIRAQVLSGWCADIQKISYTGYAPLFIGDREVGYITRMSTASDSEAGIVWSTGTRPSPNNNNILYSSTFTAQSTVASDRRYFLSSRIPIFPEDVIVGNRIVMSNYDTTIYGTRLKSLYSFGYFRASASNNVFVSITSNVVNHTNFCLISDLIALFGEELELNSEDPYTPAGPSASGTYPGQIVDGEPIGGDGTFDFDSDLIPDSSTPTNPFAGGMITGYMLTDAQMQQLAQFLWASPWDWLAQWRKLWGDPMNAIIGCFKVNLPAYSGSSTTIKLGNIDTEISALAVSGIATVNCGTVFIDKKYGSYLDYSPYTSLELYLPYIGTVGLNVDEVMGKYITVSYNVCLLDGSATCTVFVGDGTNLSVLHQYSCMVGMNVPITSAQYDGMQRSLSNVIGAVTVNIVPAITTIAGVAAGVLNPAIAAGALGGMASNIMGAEENNPVTLNKPNIRHSGGISMASGLMGRQRPYIIRHTPRMAFPEGQNTYIGYPNWTGMSLGSLSGFTRVHKIHLSCSGTEEEKAEIVRLLMEGVIL